MKKIYYLFITFILLPGVASAQAGPATDARSLLNFLKGLLNNTLIPILVTLGLVYFIWAVVGFMASKGEASKREEKKKHILWAIIGLFVILSIWGLVNLIGNTFNILRGGTLQKA